MKPLMIGLTILALALSATAANAACPSLCPSVCGCNGVTFTWDGDVSVLWRNSSNWTDDGGVGTEPPNPSGSNIIDIGSGTITNTTCRWNENADGEYCRVDVISDARDAMTLEKEGSGFAFCIYTLNLTGFSDANEATLDIDRDLMSAMVTTVKSYVTVDVLTDKSVDLGCITVDANAASAYSRLDNIGAGTLDARTLELIADQDAANDAEFEASAGSFKPDAVILTGGPASMGVAILDVDVSVTVQSECGTAATGLADIDVASGVTYTAERCFFGEASFTHPTDIEISPNGAASSVFVATSMDIVSGAASGDPTIVYLKTGDLTTSDLLRMSGTNDDVELEIDASADVVTIHSLEMNDEAVLDIDRTGTNVSVTNEFRVRNPDTENPNPKIELATGVDFRVGSFVVEENVTFTPTLTGSATFRTQ